MREKAGVREGQRGKDAEISRKTAPLGNAAEGCGRKG